MPNPTMDVTATKALFLAEENFSTIDKLCAVLK